MLTLNLLEFVSLRQTLNIISLQVLKVIFFFLFNGNITCTRTALLTLQLEISAEKYLINPTTTDGLNVIKFPLQSILYKKIISTY